MKLKILLFLVCLPLASCAVVDSAANTVKGILGVPDEPQRSNMGMMSAIPQSEYEATWMGERDKLLRELRFGKEGR